LIRELLIIFLLSFALSAISQNTVGLTQYSEESNEGYTLFAPMNATTTYLIDNCGFLVNSWNSDFKPGLSCFLRDDGLLFRTARIQSSFNVGGSGGRLEVFNWDGEMVWSYNFTSADEQSHHDISLLPNGNILVLLWDGHSFDEAVAKGKREAFISQNIGFWSEKVWEIKMLPDNQMEIVWEWNSWDHVVQDYNDTLDGYGIISEHPEKFNINYPPLSQSADWMHMNAIDYNEVLDQIVLSSRNFSEFYIIDHSTTTEEAKTGEGGIYGKGGDILYRWGNPQAYNQGADEDQILYGQHDAHWIDEGLPGAGNILVFNNGFGRPGVILASTLDEINVNPNGDGFYTLNSSNTFDPIISDWTYPEILTNDFYAGRVSGSQRLENGNTMVCLGRNGLLIEFNPKEEIVWEYICPISINGPVEQGDMVSGNDIFKTQKYGYDYLAFEGKDMSPTEPIELIPEPTECRTTSIESTWLGINAEIYPNPFSDDLNIEIFERGEYQVEIFNQVGQQLSCKQFNHSITLNEFSSNSGVFFIKLTDLDSGRIANTSIIKL